MRPSLHLLGLLALVPAVPAQAQWQALDTPRFANGAGWLPIVAFTTFNGTIVATFDRYNSSDTCASCYATFASRDGGATWTLTRDPDGALFGASGFASQGGALYAMHRAPVDAAHNGRAYRSTDGLTWTLAAPASGNGSLAQLHVTGDGALWARSNATVAMVRSTGGAWTAASEGLPANQAAVGLGGSAARVFAASGTNVYARDAEGSTWAAVPYFNTWGARAIAGDGTRLFAASAIFRSLPVPPFFAAEYLHRSTDDGATWSAVTTHPAKTIETLTVGTGGVLVTTFADSIAVSADHGASWVKVAPPEARQPATQARVEGAYLYASSSNNDRLYRRPLSDLGITVAAEAAPSASALRLDLPAPHPVRGVAALRFTVARPTAVRLAVHDVLGREVAVLFDGPAAGEQQAPFDAGTLAPGVYVARLTSGAAQVVRTFVVRP